MILKDLLKFISKHEVISIFDKDLNLLVIDDVVNEELDLTDLTLDKNVQKISSYQIFQFGYESSTSGVSILIGGE